MSVFVCKRHFWWRQIWRHPHVTMLPCWAKFSNALVHWSVRMIHAKNYKTVTKFVKVMPRILLPLFSWTRCMNCNCNCNFFYINVCCFIAAWRHNNHDKTCSETSFFVYVKNLLQIRSKMAELLPFNWFQNGGRRHLGFLHYVNFDGKSDCGTPFPTYVSNSLFTLCWKFCKCVQ